MSDTMSRPRPASRHAVRGRMLLLDGVAASLLYAAVVAVAPSAYGAIGFAGPFVPKELTKLLPARRAQSGSLIEIAPEGAFLTYGIGVPLLRMRDPAVARAHVPVRPPGPSEV